MRWETGNGAVVALEDGRVVVDDPMRTPSRMEYTWIDALERVERLHLDDHGVSIELLQELARALPDDYDSPRRTLWRAFSPGEPRSWSFTERGHHDEAPCTLRLEGAVLHRTSTRGRDSSSLIDDAFFHGPDALGLDDVSRRELRAHVEALTGGAITADQGFPDVDYAALPRRAWDFDERMDGRSSVIVEGTSVLAGYFYGRDQGSSTYPVERVITRAPGVWLGGPDELQAEVRAYLEAAVKPR